MCQPQSPNLSHLLPTPCPHIHSVCISIPERKQAHRCIFSRFHIYALMYNVCFPLSDLLHSIWQTWNPYTSLKIFKFKSREGSLFFTSVSEIIMYKLHDFRIFSAHCRISPLSSLLQNRSAKGQLHKNRVQVLALPLGETGWFSLELNF